MAWQEQQGTQKSQSWKPSKTRTPLQTGMFPSIWSPFCGCPRNESPTDWGKLPHGRPQTYTWGIPEDSADLPYRPLVIESKLMRKTYAIVQSVASSLESHVYLKVAALLYSIKAWDLLAVLSKKIGAPGTGWFRYPTPAGPKTETQYCLFFRNRSSTNSGPGHLVLQAP